MFEVFETYIQAKTRLTADELQLIRALSVERKFRRRELILQEGEVCQFKLFVTKGLLKTSVIKDDGTESVMRFAAENMWTTEHQSFTYQTPSTVRIEALEDTEVVCWTRDDMRALLASIPAYKSYIDRLIDTILGDVHHRVLMNISYTPEEKYQAFIADFPDIFRRVPLHLVASYLGVSRETLSRVRHAQLRQAKG
ncbi:MAG TPA: Crp/Fnr family transcriptional regulator [Dinghuibacter sp.]|uniref:Crp/Fnr family transcriptional regulator n=1 Tax=Dinghuibacter sp. TaxID=2024697 RepID=UPI002B9E28DF|nr:Crp/Fnr family transcriptional regulator [Dinghuibacter sp.]HTJ11796.1 Crp/Fnr family transcriptional regulator [Dinghuibacter sp.]